MKPDIKARIEGLGFGVGRVEARGKKFLVELTRAPEHVKAQVPEGCVERYTACMDKGGPYTFPSHHYFGKPEKY